MIHLVVFACGIALTFGKKYDNYWGLREEEDRMEKG
jgi:hypothetical protein